MSPADKQPEDEMRRKFREALERKQRQGKGPDQHAGDDGASKSHGKEAQPQRMHRRKSG